MVGSELEPGKPLVHNTPFINHPTMLLLLLFVSRAGGYIAGSLAVMTDAAHMMTDFVSFVVALLAISLARKKPSKKLTHGWYRAGKSNGSTCDVTQLWICMNLHFISTCFQIACVLLQIM